MIVDTTKGASEWIDQPGPYNMTVAKVDHKQVNDKTCVEYTCTDETGCKVRAKFFLTDKAMWRLTKFAKACGVPPTTSFDTTSLIGKKFVGVVDLEAANDGKVYAEVKDFHPAGTNTASVQATAAKPAAPQSHMGDGPPNDDLPF